MIRLVAPLITAALCVASPAAPAQEATPPVVVEEPAELAPREREVDPATYDSFSDWLATRGPIPGVDAGGFLAREIIDRPLKSRDGDTVGRIADIALDARAQARFFLIRRDDDTLRAVPVASVIVREDETLFTEMTPAQVEELPEFGG